MTKEGFTGRHIKHTSGNQTQEREKEGKYDESNKQIEDNKTIEERIIKERSMDEEQASVTSTL